jgi:uncharacterized membrane protein
MDKKQWKKILTRFVLGLIFILVIDNIYLYFAKDTLYKPIIDPDEKINIIPAIMCWILIVFFIEVLIMSRPDLSSTNVFMYGALLGMSSYSLYNLTNYALYPSKWSVEITVADTLWGSLLTGVTAYIMYNCKYLFIYR